MNRPQWILAAILLFGASFARAQTVEYIHTDALGSPVAVTNASGAVIERTVYEPYGAVINHPVTDGPGYTGHVSDAVTALSYMQQRYYDPGLGRFLSSDPVTATSSGGNFNRYWYANNNPYTYIDPDGRCTGSIIKNKDGTCKSTGGFTTDTRGIAEGNAIRRDQAAAGAAEDRALQRALFMPQDELSFESVALKIFPVDNPGWTLVGLTMVRGIESSDARFKTHIRPRHASDAKYPQIPRNGRFYKPILSMSTSKDQFDLALGALFNRFTPAYWTETPVGLALEFVLPAPVGRDLFSVPTNSWTVVLSPLGGGVWHLWTTYPGHPVLD